MKTKLRFAFPIALLALAGCSGLSSEYLATSAGTAAQGATNDGQGAMAPAEDAPIEQDHSAPTATGSVSKPAKWPAVERASNHGPSVFVQENPRLFAKDKDLRSWPKSDTPEGKRQKRHDQDREKKLKSVTKICSDC